jgi:hypothetical protein
MALDLNALLERARDPAAPGAELERIAGVLLAPDRARARDPRDRAVLGALAANPNAPPVLLFALAATYAAEVAANPALSLLLLENPSLLASAPVNGLCALLAQPAMPPDWFEAAARHASPHVRRAVASSRRAPAAALLRLAGDDADVVLSAVAANPSAPAAALARLGRTALAGTLTYARIALGCAVASNPRTPLATLEALAGAPAFLPAVAGNPALPMALAEALVSDQKAEVRAALAARTDLPPRLLRRLAADPSPLVRAALAQHRHDPAVLLRLSLGTEGLVRRALLENPRTPAAALERLAHAPAGSHRTAARDRLAKQGGAGALQTGKKGLSKAFAACPLPDASPGRTTTPRRQRARQPNPKGGLGALFRPFVGDNPREVASTWHAPTASEALCCHGSAKFELAFERERPAHAARRAATHCRPRALVVLP